MHDHPAQRRGKSLLTMQMMALGLAQGKRVFLATSDQKRSLKEIQRHMPGTLCEVLGDWGLRPIKRR